MAWTEEQVSSLWQLAENESLTYDDIGKELGKSGEAVRKYIKRHSYEAKPKQDHVEPEFIDLPITPETDVDEWINTLKVIQNFRMAESPVTTSATVRLNTNGKPIAFSPTSCWHLGGLYTFYDEFKEKFKEVLEIDRFYWGSHGDEWEAFPPNWANTVFTNLIPPETQKRLIAKIIEILHSKGKLLYSMWSNHPAFEERMTGTDPAKLLYRDKIPYFDGKGVLKLYVDNQLYVLSLAHKFPGYSIHNPNHPQARQLNEVPQADFVIMGDKHTYAYQEKINRLESFEAGLQENFIAHLVQTGTAKVLHDPYTIRGWSNGVFIWPVFVLSAKSHTIHRVYDRASLEWYLDRKDF